ncbi:hypothetical protein AUK40_03340 [Candidatus Wirthbacteria bacterium CG2_30_54_11]|uniref:Uncharacterized protein n=1 Tax=Candidatus Wirthbacteria bacterium CG2_30_54_11 TaxID=1817892 RepID=A0A1J5IYQ9_9BACT|nr:MAG: hypothetical protein AUK40_03340 [Candidatus Wirthbacteria bacterium CG2_30_54_11]
MDQEQLKERVCAAAQYENAVSELFASLKTAEQLVWFTEAIAAARASDPGSDVLNYWYYRLRVEKPTPAADPSLGGQPKKPGMNFFRRILIRQDKAMIALAAGIGGAFSVALWWYLQYGTAGADMRTISATFLGILFSGLWTLLVVMHDPPVKKFFVPFVAFSLFVSIGLLQFLLRFSERVASYQQLTLAISGLLMLFATAFVLRSTDPRRLPEAFEKFVSKCIETAATAFALAVPWLVVCGLGIGLLALIDVQTSTEVMSFLLSVPSMTCGFIALAMVYDQKRELSEQSSLVDTSGLFSQIALVLSFVIGGFLVVYLAILAPSKFSLILDTGTTASLFTSIVVIIQAVLYFLIGWIRQHQGSDQTWLRRCVVTLSVEAAILVSVALYAMSLRIQSYGFTVDRYFALFAVSVIFCMSAALFVLVLRMLRQKKALIDLITSITAVQFVGVVIFVLGMVVLSSMVDLEMISARNHLERVRKADVITTTLDRVYLQNGSSEVAGMLADEYPSSSRLLKADIALTLYSMKNYWNRSDQEQSTIQGYLEQQYREESDRDMKDLLRAILSASDRYSGDYYYYPGSQISGSCSQLMPGYLDISYSDALEFCGQGI